MKRWASLMLFLGAFPSFNSYAEFLHNSKTGAIVPDTRARVKVEFADKSANPSSKGFFTKLTSKLFGLSKVEMEQPIEIRKANPGGPMEEVRKAIPNVPRAELVSDIPRAKLLNEETINVPRSRPVRKEDADVENRKNPRTAKSEETTKSLLSPAELKKATDYVSKRPELVQEVVKKTQETTLKESQVELDRENIPIRNTGYTQSSSIKSAKKSQALVFDEQEANLSYQIALVYLRSQLLEQQFRAEARAEENADEFKDSKIAMQSALETALKTPMGFDVPTPDLDAESMGKNYLDLAANQLSLGLLNEYADDSEFKNLIQNALNASNSLDLDKSKLSDQLKPFQSLINSSGFSDKAVDLFGKENASAFVSSVQAAELINDNSKLLNSNALQFLGSAFSLGTSMAPPPCVGCISDATKDASADSSQATQTTLSTTNEWIEEAYAITNSSVKRAMPNDAVTNGALMRGRIELERLEASLKLYSSSGLLNLVSDPQRISMSLHYKNAVESAAHALFRVKQRKEKENPDIKVLVKSADTLFKRMTLIKKPQEMEQTLRDFFEVSKNNYIRHLWRRHEPKRYIQIKQATAQIILSRKLSLLNIPSFDKATQEKAALAYLVQKAFQSLNERKQREFEQKQLQLGLKQLAPIKMANDKNNSDSSFNILPPSDAQALPDPARFPSFSEEESPDTSF